MTQSTEPISIRETELIIKMWEALEDVSYPFRPSAGEHST
jgi:hypothetical protein